MLADDLHWTTSLSDGSEAELCRGGKTRALDPASAVAYTKAAFEARLAESRTSAMAMRHGLGTVVPQWLLPLFTWSELQLLICGRNEVRGCVPLSHFSRFRSVGFWRPFGRPRDGGRVWCVGARLLG